MDAYLAWAKRQQGDETKASPAPGSLPGSAAKDASVLRTTPLKGRKKSLMPLSVQLPTRPNPGPVAALPGVPDTEIDPTRARVNVPLRGKSDGKLGVADSPAVRDHAGAGRALLMGSARERTESASGLWVDGRERSSWTSMSWSKFAGERAQETEVKSSKDSRQSGQGGGLHESASMGSCVPRGVTDRRTRWCH